MNFFHFLKFVMNFLKGVVSICHSFQNTGQPGRINGLDRCFQVVDRCTAWRHRVSYSCACEDTNFKVLSAPHGETEAENIYHCLHVCKSCGQFICTNLFRTSNLLDSHYLKIIFSEPRLDIRTSSFVYSYILSKSLSKTFRAMIVT